MHEHKPAAVHAQATIATAADAPLLVLVSGHPASGKSTLAAALSVRLGLPVLAKDDIQEALFDAGIDASRGTGTAANHALLRVAGRVLGARRDCVLDSNLDPARWQAAVAALLRAHGARLLQVRCRADGETLVERFAARAERRHPGHRDRQRLAGLRERLLGPALEPLALPGTVLDLDTMLADDAALAAILDTVARHLGSPAGNAGRPR